MLPVTSATLDRSTAVTITAARRCGTAQANGTAKPESRAWPLGWRRTANPGKSTPRLREPLRGGQRVRAPRPPPVGIREPFHLDLGVAPQVGRSPPVAGSGWPTRATTAQVSTCTLLPRTEQARPAEGRQPRPPPSYDPRRTGQRPAENLAHPAQAPLLPLEGWAAGNL